jgi:hypothetical protein
MDEKSQPTEIIRDPELQAEALKERIYATLAILAVLLTLDATHTSAMHAAAIIGGTALSLWAASFISSRMAKRMVFGRSPQAEHTTRDSIKHAPLLASAAFPLLMVGAASIGLFTLEQAITMSIGAILLTLVLWSLAAARSMHASKLASILLAAIVLLIGLGVVALKALVAH